MLKDAIPTPGVIALCSFAGKATYGVQVNAVAVQALQRPASVDLRPDPANPRSKPDLASSAGWVATYPKVGKAEACTTPWCPPLVAGPAFGSWLIHLEKCSMTARTVPLSPLCR